MRCKQCDAELSDFEATRKDIQTGEYFDLCNDCFKPIQKLVRSKERLDLLRKKDLQDLDKDEEISVFPV